MSGDDEKYVIEEVKDLKNCHSSLIALSQAVWDISDS